MSRPLPAWIAILAHILTAAGTLLLVLVIHGQFNAQEAGQRRAGQLVEQKICADVGAMSSIKPPAGSAAANPSRAYEQAEHQTWSELFAGLGCSGGRR